MNDEIDIDGMMARLSEMLPEASDELLLEAILNTGSVESAFDWIMDQERQHDIETKADQTVLQEIIQLFPSVEKSIITHIVAAFPELEVEELIDTVIGQLVNRRKTKYVSVKDRIENVNGGTVSDAPISINSFKEALELRAQNIAEKSSSDGKIQAHSGPTTKTGFHYDFGVEDISEVTETSECYRDLAQDLIHDRSRMYSKAADSYQRGGLTGKGYSSYLSEEGAQLTARINKLNAMAAYAALKHFNPKLSNSRTIDLHGLTVREAEAVVPLFLKHHLIENETEMVQIVTGHGRGSSQGARLRPFVYGMLSSSRFNFSFDNFAVFTVFRN